MNPRKCRKIKELRAIKANFADFPKNADFRVFMQKCGKSVEKLGSKIVQVKGVMPPKGGITRETPTGRAVGRFVVWHNFFLIQGKCYVIF